MGTAERQRTLGRSGKSRSLPKARGSPSRRPVAATVVAPTPPDWGEPKVDGNQTVRFWQRGAEAVIFEYYKGQRLQNLSFPNEKGRDYYKQGDIILTEKRTRKDIETRFPELKGPTPQMIPALWVLKLLLGPEDPPTYTVGFKLLNIFPNTSVQGELTGRGSAIMAPLIVFSEDAPVVLTDRIEWKEQGGVPEYELDRRFIFSRTARDNAELIPVLRAIGAFVEYSLGGAAKGVGKALARQAARRVAKQGAQTAIKTLFKKVLKVLEHGVVSGVLEFFKAFGRDVLQQFREMLQKKQERREHVTFDSACREFLGSDARIERATLKGAEALVTSFLKSVLEEPMAKEFNQVLKAMSPDGSGWQFFRQTLKQEAIKVLTVNVVRGIISDVFQGLQAGWQGSTWDFKKFDTAATQAFGLDRPASGIVNERSKDLGAQLASGWAERMEDTVLKGFLQEIHR